MDIVLQEPGMGETTTISVPVALAQELNDRKEWGESYADVIERLLEQTNAERAESAPERTEEPDVPEPAPEPPAGTDGDLDALVDAVADDALPGSGAKLEQRREAFHAVVDYLREHGSGTPLKFKEEIYSEHDGGYQSDRSWWKNAMYPALRELADHVDELERADTTGRWLWSNGE